ncbi:MAG: M81 family metallopeptidase [Anaerolineaceae bacterium]|nr:M81 family metallopeptidase [Anaerolineaceae bacterium]
MKKIVVSEFCQETNSFNPVVTTLEDFKRRGIFEGKEMRTIQGPRALVGIFQAIEEDGGEIIPACSMNSQSGGLVDQPALDYFIEKTLGAIKQNKPVDGVFLSLHGATQTTEYDDACGIILESVRKEVGDDVVITASADLHANVTPKMMKNADFICGYQSYPHVDFFNTGYRAAKLGMRSLRGEKLHMVQVSIPMIFPASGYSSLTSPFRELINDAKELVETGKLCDCSIFQMQPWLDVDPAAGSVVIAIAADVDAARMHAVQLGQRLLDMRDQFKPDLFTIDQVIDLATENKSGKPVILVDSADSANAGSTGDSAVVLQRLLERKLDVKTALVVNDARAAELAHEIGVGSRAVFSIGGTRNPDMFNPVRVEAYVKSLHDGTFCLEGPAGRGIVVNIGRTAVISVGKIDIVVCRSMLFGGDPQIFRGFGIEPTFYQMVVVKACTSFRAAYNLFADVICLTDTPGAASADLKSLPYKKIPNTFYPFSTLEDYRIKM